MLTNNQKIQYNSKKEGCGSYADPDATNLVNADPDPGPIQDNKITKLFKTSFDY